MLNWEGPYTEPNDEAGVSIREGFHLELARRRERLDEVHTALGSQYDADQLEALEALVYDTGSWFSHALYDESWPYWPWVQRSAECQHRMKEIIAQADEAAFSFQQAAAGQFSRARCRRLIEALLISIDNLRRFDDARTE